MTSSKACFKCGIERPLDEFYKHKMMADGHLNKCKDCTKLDASNHRAKNIDKIRRYDRERAKRPERAKSAAEIARRWRASDSRISSAHSAVARAVRSGAMVRPSGCRRCGGAPVFGHHENYDRKLDVTWLCQPCHKLRHREMAMQGIDP